MKKPAPSSEEVAGAIWEAMERLVLGRPMRIKALRVIIPIIESSHGLLRADERERVHGEDDSDFVVTEEFPPDRWEAGA